MNATKEPLDPNCNQRYAMQWERGGERVSKGNNAMGCNANSNIPIILTILNQAPEKKTTSTSKPKAKKATTGVTSNNTTKTKGKSEAAKARDEARCSFGIVLIMNISI